MTAIAENTFAAACYDSNTIAELESALASGPDARDLEEWGLTDEEWRAEIELALAAKREDQQ